MQPAGLGSASQRQRMKESMGCSGSHVRTSMGCDKLLLASPLAVPPESPDAPTLVPPLVPELVPTGAAWETGPLCENKSGGSLVSPSTRTRVSFTNLSFPPAMSQMMPKREDP